MPDLVAEHGVRRLPLKKDDFVIITKGEFADIEGKVKEIEPQIFVESRLNGAKGHAVYNLLNYYAVFSRHRADHESRKQTYADKQPFGAFAF